MHGLIFETSIWLLAGSTRLIHHNLAMRAIIHNEVNNHYPSQDAVDAVSQKWPQLDTKPSEAEPPGKDVSSHLQTCHLKTDMLSVLKLKPDLRRTSANPQMLPFWLWIAPLTSCTCPKTRTFEPPREWAEQTPCDCSATEQSNGEVWHHGGPHKGVLHV
jgi:hypothetical protein